jgi:hypothetical protein
MDEYGAPPEQAEYAESHRFSHATATLLNMSKLGCIGFLYWFWFSGVSSVHHRADSCEEFAFSFYRVSLDGWVV